MGEISNYKQKTLKGKQKNTGNVFTLHKKFNSIKYNVSQHELHGNLVKLVTRLVNHHYVPEDGTGHSCVTLT